MDADNDISLIELHREKLIDIRTQATIHDDFLTADLDVSNLSVHIKLRSCLLHLLRMFQHSLPLLGKE